ncbi:hypothetical protein [Rhodococcus ruber]|nr:hypothetical protein [Rhodococcus ruber]MCF8783399.1 hypothetical protein [Rhodococcus ruber]
MSRSSIFASLRALDVVPFVVGAFVLAALYAGGLGLAALLLVLGWHA